MKESPQQQDDKLSNDSETSTLVLYNDEVNTFDNVIKALVEVCQHDLLQAEQCAMIVHFKGSCEVKTGEAGVLLRMSRSLNVRGLNSKVCTKA